MENVSCRIKHVTLKVPNGNVNVHRFKHAKWNTEHLNF